MTERKVFKTSLVLKAEDAQTALIIWSSIYPNFSSRDIEEGRLQAELSGHEIHIVLRDEGLSKLRARISSILMWLDIICALLRSWK